MKPRYIHQCQICSYPWVNGVEFPDKCANPDCRSYLWNGREKRRPGPKRQRNGESVFTPSTISEFRDIDSLHKIITEQAPEYLPMLFTQDKEYMKAEISESSLRRIRMFFEYKTGDTPTEDVESAYRALNMISINGDLNEVELTTVTTDADDLNFDEAFACLHKKD